MPRFILAASLVLIAIAIHTPVTAQTTSKNSAAKPVAASSATAKKVTAPADAVITIHGLCSESQSGKSEDKSGSACTTVVTKEQFEVVVDALNAIGPQLVQAQRR